MKKNLRQGLKIQHIQNITSLFCVVIKQYWLKFYLNPLFSEINNKKLHQVSIELPSPMLYHIFLLSLCSNLFQRQFSIIPHWNPNCLSTAMRVFLRWKNVFVLSMQLIKSLQLTPISNKSPSQENAEQDLVAIDFQEIFRRKKQVSTFKVEKLDSTLVQTPRNYEKLTEV